MPEPESPPAEQLEFAENWLCETLSAEFPHLTHREIAETVHSTNDRFTGATISAFLPNLMLRECRETLKAPHPTG